MKPKLRPGLGDDPGRKIVHGFGWLEYRYGPANTVEIVNIEVEEGHRQKGIGAFLLMSLLGRLKDGDYVIYAFTRDTNLPAHVFYERTGFDLAGELRGFYPDGSGGARVYAMKVKG